MAREQQLTGTGPVVAGRQVPRVYRVSGKHDVVDVIENAVAASGGKILYGSDPKRVPLYLGVQEPTGNRLGVLIYPFRVTKRDTKNRPADEVRGQLRYGSEDHWKSEDHVVARDVAGVDITVLIGVDPEQGILLGFDPALYDPMPLGISLYGKLANIEEARRTGWASWEQGNRAGKVRLAPRTSEGSETVVAFTPERFLDYVQFERHASSLGLDAPLRFAAATGDTLVREPVGSHNLEHAFDLSAQEILDIISTRMRLEVAVKGGVAEHHLEKYLRSLPEVQAVERLDADGQPDFKVALVGGRTVTVECKNASPTPYKDGADKVEVQKTRATRDDPAGRLYRVDQFDIVAACLYSRTGAWEFRFQATSRLDRHKEHSDRLTPIQRIDDRWSITVAGAIAALGEP